MNATTQTAVIHPIDHLMRADRLPHILCAGCGIGTVIHGYVHAIGTSGVEADKHVCVSGIGCSGRAAGYVNVDSYHTTHGRALPFALGIAVHNPDLVVTVISGDGDYIPVYEEVMRQGKQVSVGALTLGLNPRIPSRVDYFEYLDDRLYIKN